MSAVVVTGYASLDYALRLDRAPRADETATILSRPAQWPRLGGSPAYVVAALVAGGVADCAPVSWVGDDADGERYIAALAGRGVDARGVARRPGRTPVCVLAYQPDGGCHCFYDPGPIATELDERQRGLIEQAQWLCLTVGPCEATRAALAALPPQAKLVWAVKADARAVPPDLAAAIAARADIVAYSRREADFAAKALAAASPRAPPWLLQTRGEDGVALTLAGETQVFAAARLPVEDATGAGDSLLGGFLAGLIRGEDARTAVVSGTRAAHAMLEARLVAGGNG